MNLKKYTILVTGLLFSSLSQAQITSAVVQQTQAAATFNTDRIGYGVLPAQYSTATTYNLHFGVNSSGTSTTIPVLQNFQYGGITYIQFVQSGTKPFSNIKFNRIIYPTSIAQNPDKFTGYFEYSSIPASPNNNRYFKAEYSDNPEDLINSYVLNRGVDNVFANRYTATANNVERIDLIQNAGLVIPAGVSLDKMGIMVVDRGGNDSYKVAVITSLDTNGNISGLGNLISRTASNFGSTGYSLRATVFQNANNASPTSEENLIKPSGNSGLQNVSGDFIRFSELGVLHNQAVYGIAVFPNDFDQTMDLIGLTNTPADTDGNIGGLDIMGGGGLYVTNDVAFISLSGNVYQDVITNNEVDGIGIGNLSGQQLYAYLVNGSGTVIFKTIVNSNGTYSFPSTILDIASSNNYSLVVDTQNFAVSGTVTTSSIIPSGWFLTGEDYGNGNLAGTGVETGTPNLRIPIEFNPASPAVSNVNFGLNIHCVKPGLNSSTPDGYTKVGISNLKTRFKNWPEGPGLSEGGVPNGFVTLESKEKGFVITRVANSGVITDPKKGMLIYDIAAACVKLYNGSYWNCLQKSCNE